MLIVLVCTVGCDQTTKHIARRELGIRGSVRLPGGFGEFRLAENPGSFLSLGDSFPKSLRLGIFTMGVSIGLLSLLGFLVFGHPFRRFAFVGFGLIWAGGVSNLIDRIMRDGLVSDFIFIRIGPFHTGVFNVADVVILVGSAVIAWDFWWRRQQDCKRSMEN